MGFTPQEADAVFFHTRVLGDGKAEGQLEAVQEQIGLIAAMGESKSEFILLSFRDLSETGDGMIGAWGSGDAEGLPKLFLEECR
jgi:hypothetical protein